jgi:hypothetical protein
MGSDLTNRAMEFDPNYQALSIAEKKSTVELMRSRLMVEQRKVAREAQVIQFEYDPYQSYQEAMEEIAQKRAALTRRSKLQNPIVVTCVLCGEQDLFSSTSGWDFTESSVSLKLKIQTKMKIERKKLLPPGRRLN